MKIKGNAKFWLEIGAWALALAVLVAALICFNISKDKPENNGGGDVTVGNGIGDLCPDFTLDLYQGGGQYNLYENRGKITLINFWYIGCGGCEAEMPFIGELSLSEEYDVEIVAIHGLYAMSSQVDAYLQKERETEPKTPWCEYDIKFAQDILVGNNQYQTYKALGGKQFWPLTVILDEKGIVRYNSTKEFKSFDELRAVIDGIINN